ncbi:hypothetical protein FGRMN_7081 [Fusarium graminum]|nr:hypothetical protein FGRMN_7081 [Fusarium graminum]
MLTAHPSSTFLLTKAESSSTDPAPHRARHSRVDLIYNSSPKRVPWPEIVLACYDDGDVVAYYTEQIAKRIFSSRGTTDMSHTSAPKQFFHENVGRSAWGLSIHQKSRLIAVSSNRHEVVVFALALTQDTPSRRGSWSRATQLDIQTRTRNWRIVIRLPPKAENMPNVCFVNDSQGNAQRICAVDIRGTAWLADIWQGNRGPIALQPLCSDLLRSEEFFPGPSRGWGIFALDEEDFLKVKTTEELFGVPTNRLEFVPASNGCSQPLVNVRNALTSIPDNPHSRLRPSNQPGQPPPFPWDQGILQPGFAMQEPVDLLGSDGSDDAGEGELEDTEEESEDEGEEEDDSEDDSELDSEEDAIVTTTEWNTLSYFQVQAQVQGQGQGQGQAHVQTHAQKQAQGQNIGEPAASHPDNLYAWDATLKQEDSNKEHRNERRYTREAAHGDAATPYKLDMTYFPHNNKVYPTPRNAHEMMAFLARRCEHNQHSLVPETQLANLGRKLLLLRTYEKDIELRSFSPFPSRTSPSEIGVICPDALKFGRFRDPGLHLHFHATSRLNMIALAPELSLMAIGSPTGRVVLLTLTRKAVSTDREERSWEHGFRVEWVLPTGSDEMEHRKTLRPMHGMALGPVQAGDDIGGKVGGGGPAMPRRYRLMLHYRNHDIFSYELTREEQTGKLCIF